MPTIHSHKVEISVAEESLHNASGFDSCSEHILLGGDVGGVTQAVQRAQVTEGERGTD